MRSGASDSTPSVFPRSAGHGGAGTLVFDEIDANVGARLGDVLGGKLAALAKTHQVICVTHLATVASCARHHWTIRKTKRGGRTVTQIARLEDARASDPGRGFAAGARSTWQWLVDADHRALLVLWLEVYALSVADPDGPWTGFARQTVEDWLDLLAGGQELPSTKQSSHERTLCLAVLRGALLDLLATGDTDRVEAAVKRYLRTLSD